MTYIVIAAIAGILFVVSLIGKSKDRGVGAAAIVCLFLTAIVFILFYATRHP